MLRARYDSSDEEEARPPPRRQRREGPGVPDPPARVPRQTPVGHPFRHWLLSRYSEGRISAKDVCSAAYEVQPFAEQLGVADLALRPDSSSANFEKKLARVVGHTTFEQNAIWQSQIPIFSKKNGRTNLQSHPFLMPHDRVHRDPASWLPAPGSHHDSLTLPVVQSHPMVVQHGASNIVSLLLYLFVFACVVDFPAILLALTFRFVQLMCLVMFGLFGGLPAFLGWRKAQNTFS